MTDIGVFKMAHALIAHASDRQVQVARNVANADTPGYRARDLPGFDAALGASGALRTTRPQHIASPAGGEAALVLRGAEPSPNGNDVSLETEMLAAADIRQQYDMALSIYTSGREITKAALGRR